MNRKFNEVLQISTPYKPEPGSYASYQRYNGEKYRILNWHYCRDIFHRHLCKLDLFFFAHDLNKSYNIASFMEIVERKVNIDYFSEYGPTQKKSIMWIRPSKWWTIKPMRRSLFTILLRCGNNYNPSKKNFKEALFSEPYAAATEYAINRFLKGYTYYTGSNKNGWLDQFYESRLDKKSIDSLLIKPKY